MSCYFQGCSAEGVNKEHIPPRSFFPVGEKEQLMTVVSCEAHNNAKSKDDLYVLAQICMNSSPSNRAFDVWQKTVAPQLEYNNGALRKRLAAGSVRCADKSVIYRVDVERMNSFFTALSCGIVHRVCKSSLPENYAINHIYRSLLSEGEGLAATVDSLIDGFYSEKPMDVLDFGDPGVKNERIYTVSIYGLPEYRSSITVVHKFFGKFKVLSMLTRTCGDSDGCNSEPSR